MRTFAVLLSRFLAIASASVGMMAIAMMTHTVLTPLTRGPRMEADGPGAPLQFGIGGLGAAIVLGLLSYAFARIGSRGESEAE
jgi:acyl-CoA hydrolase